MKKATLDECFAFVRNFPKVCAGDIPTKILRTLNLKLEPNDYYLKHPRLAPIHEFIRFVLSNYEKRLGIKIRIVSQKEMFDLMRRKDCRWLLCYFLEYCYLPQERTVFIEQDEYDGRCATFLDYVHAILKSRKFYRIPIYREVSVKKRGLRGSSKIPEVPAFLSLRPPYTFTAG